MTRPSPARCSEASMVARREEGREGGVRGPSSSEPLSGVMQRNARGAGLATGLPPDLSPGCKGRAFQRGRMLGASDDIDREVLPRPWGRMPGAACMLILGCPHSPYQRKKGGVSVMRHRLRHCIQAVREGFHLGGYNGRRCTRVCRDGDDGLPPGEEHPQI